MVKFSPRSSYLRFCGWCFSSIFGISCYASIEPYVFSISKLWFWSVELSFNNLLYSSASSFLLFWLILPSRYASNPSEVGDSNEHSLMYLSVTSNLQQESPKEWFFMSLDKLNLIFPSPTLKVSFPCLTSTMTPTMARKGLWSNRDLGIFLQLHYDEIGGYEEPLYPLRIKVYIFIIIKSIHNCHVQLVSCLYHFPSHWLHLFSLILCFKKLAIHLYASHFVNRSI